MTYVPPVVPAACGVPAKAAGAQWMAATNERFGSPRLAWGGKEAALAYAETVTGSGWAIKLQRLTEAGMTTGSPVAIGTSKAAATNAVAVTVATDGAEYIVCWDGAEAGAQIDCASVSIANPQAAVGLSAVNGSSPSVAIGSSGFALSYYDGGGSLVIQALDATAKPVGSPSSFGPATGAPTKLVATTSGFAVIAGGYDLYRLDATLKAVGSKAHVATTTAPPGVAAVGDTIGLAWVDNGADAFEVIPSSNTPSAEVSVNGTMGGSYSQIAVASGANSFAVVWSDTGASVGYRAVDSTGKPIGMPQNVANTAWDDNPVAVTGIGDGFLVATAATPSSNSMELTHLGCP